MKIRALQIFQEKNIEDITAELYSPDESDVGEIVATARHYRLRHD